MRAPDIYDCENRAIAARAGPAVAALSPEAPPNGGTARIGQ